MLITNEILKTKEKKIQQICNLSIVKFDSESEKESLTFLSINVH